MNKNKSIIAIIIMVIIIVGVYLFIQTFKIPSQGVTPQVSNISTASAVPHTDFKEISRGNAEKKEVIITINAGFGEKSADGILTALAKHKIKTTFFLVGQWVEDHPELTRRIAREGHEIFNHSYSHPDYTLLTPAEIKADLQKMDDVLYKVAGIRTRPYFRAPFGYRNEAVKRAGAEIGFQHIYWSVDAIDWREGETGETIKKRVLSYIHPGAIVLLHIGDIPTGDIADELFTELEQRGYKLVSLTESLGL